MSDDQPTHYAPTLLMEALYLDSDQEALQWVKDLLDSGEDPSQIDISAGSIPLLEAWESGRVEIMHLLIKAGATGSPIKDLPFEIAYCFANTSIEATLLLIESGFSLHSLLNRNELDEQICCGDNLLTDLLENDRMEYIEALKPHGVMDFLQAFDELGDAPLGTMARDGHLEQAKWLIQHGADANAHCSVHIRSTPLDRAIESTDVEMTSLLLAAGANPNIPTWMWITATDRAVNFMPDFEFRRKENRNIPDAVKIREMILKASKNFPPPTYPNGSKPTIWPPEPKANS